MEQIQIKIMYDRESPIFLHLDLSNFKTTPCTLTVPHEVKRCFFFHFPSEKRRSLNDIFYSKILCNKKNACNDSGCKYSHNYIEQIYHVDNYKKKYCKDFIETGRCKYADYCALAHSDYELKICPLHLLPIDRSFLLFQFKSEFCPFSKINHDRFTCVYAHNWQDFKRPFFQKLKPVPCKNWNKDKEILEYFDGCARGFDCDFCHGWKECEYHILNFKKFNCKKGNKCERKNVCSFRHDDMEAESENTNSEYFSPVMKNMFLMPNRTLEYLAFIEAIPNLPETSHFSSVKETPRSQKAADLVAWTKESSIRKLVIQSSNNIKTSGQKALVLQKTYSSKAVPSSKDAPPVIQRAEHSDKARRNSHKKKKKPDGNSEMSKVKAPPQQQVDVGENENSETPNSDANDDSEWGALGFLPKKIKNNSILDIDEANEFELIPENEDF